MWKYKILKGKQLYLNQRITGLVHIACEVFNYAHWPQSARTCQRAGTILSGINEPA